MNPTNTQPQPSYLSVEDVAKRWETTSDEVRHCIEYGARMPDGMRLKLQASQYPQGKGYQIYLGDLGHFEHLLYSKDRRDKSTIFENKSINIGWLRNSLLVLAIAFIVVLALGYIEHWEWTGLYQTVPISQTGQSYTSFKTLWDWLVLLFVPAILGGLGIWLSRKYDQNNQDIIQENQRSQMLQDYFKDLSIDISSNKIRVVKAKTSMILAGLSNSVVPLSVRVQGSDNVRKGNVVRFLYQLNVINKDHTPLEGDKFMEGMRLEGATLRWAQLYRVNLAGAWLYKAELAESNLAEANLTDVYLREADLRKADLTGADLTEARLMGADLTGVNLADANLTGADLTGADLTDANLTGIDLTGTNLAGAILKGADLTGADLTDAWLVRADLIEANLTYARLVRAKLTDAKRTQANTSLGQSHRQANRDNFNVTFISPDLIYTGLISANLTNANLTDADLTNADLTNANLAGAGLTNANFTNAIVTDEQLKQAKSLAGATLPDGSKRT